jgi:hypothetical protein
MEGSLFAVIYFGNRVLALDMVRAANDYFDLNEIRNKTLNPSASRTNVLYGVLAYFGS